jgi:hypothetical protein
VRRVIVAHPVSGGRGVDIAREEEPPRFLQPELLLKLQRAQHSNTLAIRCARPPLTAI